MHPIPPGLYCVPSVIVAITGADLMSVVIPALNRAGKEDWLLGPVGGVPTHETVAALESMGWCVRRYRDRDRRAELRTVARLSKERWPGHALLACTSDHALAVQDGLVYDTYTPHGALGANHPFARDRVSFLALVEPGPQALGHRP